VPSVEAHLDIDAREAGSRLDRALQRLLGDGQRPLIMRLIRKGNVRVNGRRAKPEQRLAAGDRIFLPASLRADAQDRGAKKAPAFVSVQLPVLYEDADLLVIDKPAGLVVHGGSGHAGGVIEMLKSSRELPELRLAHRIDRDTSGCLLMAKHLAALRRLTEAFRERDMQKTYFALVSGHPEPHAARMRSQLSKGILRGGERMVVDAESGKEAVTDYQVMLERGSDGLAWAMVALSPHSGRTHQLRVQLQAEGHAILGDPKYAEKEELRAFRALGCKGLMLHAWRLRFVHPVTGKAMEIRAPIPENWRTMLEAKGGSS
jgi:23S rRNA pseudouridine955/2504/2580 synthase